MASLTTVYFVGILLASLSAMGSAFLGNRIFPLKGGSVVTPIEEPKEEEKPVPVEDEEEKPLQVEDEEEKPLQLEDEEEEKPLAIEDKVGGKKRRRLFGV